jgi:hypothetical protein
MNLCSTPAGEKGNLKNSTHPEDETTQKNKKKKERSLTKARILKVSAENGKRSSGILNGYALVQPRQNDRDDSRKDIDAEILGREMQRSVQDGNKIGVRKRLRARK